MVNIRCGSCSALLFKAGAGAIANTIEIKCRRCGTLNHLRPAEPTPDRLERPDKGPLNGNRKLIS
ncbi:Com family DNA-binding transcriptional regulator [Agrobacterium vitis]|uniref:Com family DNA-binding transcriptional regulator n=1 Tax=Agrobacterium vitis TaxID=373 RepID=UPI001572957C|nr:Com family DNA-binding transcriptional regulator [Agrobacterium vitis]UJL73032.1 Com family DNA-binding transcriptional regulator [Agrobacterium vitis]